MKKEEEFDEEEEFDDDDDDDDDALEKQLSQITKNQETLDEKLKTFSTGASKSKDSNFLHVQISSEELLKKLENFYSGKVEVYDPQTKTRKWVQNPDPKMRTFNDYGVQCMMEIVSRYIDKNTTLSSYREERINEIIADIGEDLTLFIQVNYKAMGMDTSEKKTKFRLVITTTCHIIESAYRRALHGMTLEKVNESRAVHQFDNNLSQRAPTPEKKGGWLSKLIPA